MQSAQGVSRDPGTDAGLPQITVAVEHYGRLVRAMQKNVPVKLELDIKNSFQDDNPQSFNVIAEIPGTDKAAEIVMLGAHFDSWHGAHRRDRQRRGVGGDDGSDAHPEGERRATAPHGAASACGAVRSRGCSARAPTSREHFASREDMALKPEHARLSGYFNMDNGTGAIRGVYLQGNEAVAPIFEEWMKPFRNLGMTTLTIRDTGGTDHQSFDAVGLPGFQFIQDPVEYDTRTHHTNMDLYERVQEADMRENAVIVAAFVYQTANREDKLPRKPMPSAQPAGRGTGAAGAMH